jgi:heme-degrading monooxygenase HmoA
MIVVMVRIPVSTSEEAENIVTRFKNRKGMVDNQPGFLGFELLRAEGELISVSRWATQADLDRWTASQSHADAHAQTSDTTGGGSGHTPHGTGGPVVHAGSAGVQEPSSARTMRGNVTVYEVVIPAEGNR